MGWTANPARTRFTWRDRSAQPIGGLTAITVRANAAGVVTFAVTGKAGSYPVGVADLPLRGTFVVDAPLATGGQCGETQAPPMLRKRSANGASVVCKQPLVPRPRVEWQVADATSSNPTPCALSGRPRAMRAASATWVCARVVRSGRGIGPILDCSGRTSRRVVRNG